MTPELSGGPIGAYYWAILGQTFWPVECRVLRK